jgi:rhodanese-related sulfurtransferase
MLGRDALAPPGSKCSAPKSRHQHNQIICVRLLPLTAAALTEEELKEREQYLARQQQERETLQQQAAANLLPDPLQAVSDVISAYTAEQGFRQMSVQDLSVALTAGGLVDLVLDVRTQPEFAAGVACGRHAQLCRYCTGCLCSGCEGDTTHSGCVCRCSQRSRNPDSVRHAGQPVAADVAVDRQAQQWCVRLDGKAVTWTTIPERFATIAGGCTASVWMMFQGASQPKHLCRLLTGHAGSVLTGCVALAVDPCCATGPTIPTAVNIPLDMLSDAVRAGQLDPYHTSSIAVVCASGQRSAQATVRLTKVFAFKNVSNVSGGMSAWQQMQAELKGGSGGCGCGSSGSGGCSK